MNRTEMLQRLEDVKEWDIIIIGGGATGLGSALDAASRGYKTLLIEQFDFGKGTSSRSTKLVHGGVRYLAQGNIKLVLEALRERGYLLKNAPYVTSTLAFIIPAYSWWDKIFYGIGLRLYDMMSGKLSIGKTKLLSKKETIKQLPGIDEVNLIGGILYYDGQFDDTRLATDLANTATKYNAAVLNYVKASSLIKTNEKLSGLIAEDTITGKQYQLQAKAIINATGVFTDTVLQMDEPGEAHLVAPSQGIHLVVDKKFFPGSNALMIPKTDDGRVLFAVPWHDKVILGTTDTPIEQVSIEPKPLEEEIEFILHHSNLYLKQTISRADVQSMYAGLRPLVKKRGAAKTSVLSRDHTILVSKSNLVTITGGKWTTYRKMAEDAIDNAVFIGKLERKVCITKQLPIGNEKKDGNYFLHTQQALTDADIKQYIEFEMAVTVEDILARRTRILFTDARSAIDKAPEVARQMAALLNKDEAWVRDQINSFTTLAKQYIL